MAIFVLKTLRYVTPGFLILIMGGVLGTATELWPGYWPENPEQASKSLGLLSPAGVYYLTPLRSWANRSYHADIAEHLRGGLIKIAGLTDNPEIYSWKAIRGIFFKIIDSDPSLTKKSHLAYFNG